MNVFTVVRRLQRAFGAHRRSEQGVELQLGVDLLPTRPNACRIYLVRHGQTVMNTQVRFRGRRDVPLNEIGRAEALIASRTLAPCRISAVYASPLERALDVGLAIAARAGVHEVLPQTDLVNLEYGEWEGLTKEECAESHPAEFGRYLCDPENAACPGGESVAAGADRIMRGLQWIGERHPGESVAAVSHGAMVRLAVLRAAGPSDLDWQFAMPTGGAVVFDVEEGEVLLARAVDRSRPDPRKAGTAGVFGVVA